MQTDDQHFPGKGLLQELSKELLGVGTFVSDLVEERGLFLYKRHDGRFLVRNDFGFPGTNMAVDENLLKALTQVYQGTLKARRR